MTVTKPLYDLILQKKTHYPLSVIESQIQAKKQLHQSKQQQTQDTADNLLPQLSESSQRSMVLTQEKGASSWLTTLPISEHGFALHKGAFRDALALSYGWNPPNTPSHCICGKSFTMELMDAHVLLEVILPYATMRFGTSLQICCLKCVTM